MKRLIWGVIFLIALATPVRVRADGMMIRPDPYSDRWDYASEEEQQALIEWKEGRQEMTLAVGSRGMNLKGMVWIVPVPAGPEKTVIEIADKLPRFYGEEIGLKARKNLENIREAGLISQIYPLYWVMTRNFGYSPTELGLAPTGLKGGINGWDEITVHEHIEKEGMVSELISAETGTGLYNYLRDKGLRVMAGEITVLEHYIGKDYSFVVSWIEGEEVVGNYKQRGFKVSFPAKKIYFPMMPTSVYGSQVVPATIRVRGWWRPEIFEDIKGFVETKYYVSAKDRYTRIEITAPAKLMSQDLWMKKGLPAKNWWGLVVATRPFWSGLVIIGLASAISGMMAGWLVFRKNMGKYGWVGLANLVSIVGVIVAMAVTNTKEADGAGEMMAQEIKWKLKKADEVKRIAKRLKELGYSRWFWVPKDKRKWLFTPVFSICFLLVLTGIIKLIALGW